MKNTHKVIKKSDGGTKREVIRGTYDLCLTFCKEHNWELDEGYVWDLEIEEVEPITDFALFRNEELDAWRRGMTSSNEVYYKVVGYLENMLKTGLISDELATHFRTKVSQEVFG